jgi:ADP-heptose:LPS heptosyltransferase
MSKNHFKQRGSNILVVAVTRIGDMLQASPTIAGFKLENPAAKVTVLVEKSFAAICDGIPNIDEVIQIDLALINRCLNEDKEGLIEAYKYVDQMIADLKAKQFDFCINMSSSSYTAFLIKLLGIEDSRGWISDDEGNRQITTPWARLFAAFIYHGNREYNGLNIVDIFRCSAGVKEHPDRLLFNVNEEARSKAKQLISSKFTSTYRSDNGPVICLQAGASQEKRQWNSRYFAQVSKLLVERLNAKLIFTGTKSEAPIIDQVFAQYSHPNMVSVAGETKLDELAGILEQADLLVTGDTGPMHLSVAVGTPVVSLFLASALGYETGPYGEGNIVIQPQIACSPCNPIYTCSTTECHQQISPELVYELVEMRLKTQAKEVKNITLSSSYANPSQVAVYVTCFDEDSFYDMKQINPGKAVGKNGHSARYFENARNAYKKLWKEELDGIVSQFPVNQFSIEKEGLPEDYRVNLERIVNLSHAGTSLIEQLVGLIRNEQSSANALGVISSQMSQVDRQLEDVGLSTPVIGALIRMFVMEKENMQSEDAESLAWEMGDLYRTLAMRIEKFERYYEYYAQNN